MIIGLGEAVMSEVSLSKYTTSTNHCTLTQQLPARSSNSGLSRYGFCIVIIIQSNVAAKIFISINFILAKFISRPTLCYHFFLLARWWSISIHSGNGAQREVYWWSKDSVGDPLHHCTTLYDNWNERGTGRINLRDFCADSFINFTTLFSFLLLLVYSY